MESEQQSTLKQQYLAAMSREMKAPIETIMGLTDDLFEGSSERVAQIQNAARYLRTLIDELSEFARD